MLRPRCIAVLPLLFFIFAQSPAPAQTGKGKLKDEGELTPEQVAAAHKAVTSFGCSHAGYGGEDGEGIIKARRRAAAVLNLPKDPADYARELYFSFGVNRFSTAYALRFPERAGDNDIARLAVSLRRLPHLKALDLGGTHITDASLKSLADAREIDSLFLDGTGVGDAGLKELGGRFVWLDLSKTQITDKGMAEIGRNRNLRVLRLANNPKITEAGLRELGGLEELRSLELGGTSIDFSTAGDLSAWKHLKHLDLSRTGITDDTVKSLAKLTALEELDLSGTMVTGAGLSALAGLPKLRILRLTDAPITDDGAKGIAALKQIRMLHVNNSPPTDAKSAKVPGKVRLTDAGLEALGGCTALRELNLARAGIKGEGFKGFGKHPYLRDLDLDGAAVNASAFTELRGVPNLRGLNLARTAITGDGLHLLGELAYLTRLSLEESKANDEGMNFVFRLKALRDLNLQGTAVTTAGIKSIADNVLVQLNLANTKVDGQAVKLLAGMKGLRALYIQGSPLAASAGQLKTALPDCSVISQPPPKPPARATTPPPRLPVE
jgi:Leucine-rich repeat (LRR) protein